MKTSLWIVIVIVALFMGFLFGYGVSVRTGIKSSAAPAHVGGGYGSPAGGYGTAPAGGYGAAPAAGGYGAPAGGHGTPKAGGYGAPAGGYGK